MSEAAQLQATLAEDISSFTHDPLGYSLYAFPWGVKGTELEKFDGPREWQRDGFNIISEHLKNPETRHQPCKIAVASGHGIGKSAHIGMMIKWGMDTCEDCRIVCTANTENQLRTKTVPEITKWSNLSITRDWFTLTATSMYSNVPKHDKSWRADFVPWSKDNTESFAGLHNVGKRIIILMDEGSSIDDKIYEVVEGALTDEDTEIIWIVYGNPTRNMGRFRECFRKQRHTWHHRKIDSRTCEGTNKKQLQAIVDLYGEDSDVVRVRVRGEFPSASAFQFISTDVLDGSKDKKLEPSSYNFAPVILTCDPAWTGEDYLVIGKRQGLHYEELFSLPKNDNDVMIANKLGEYEDIYKADAVMIDLGFGQGIYSAGKTMGRKWTLVGFNDKSLRNDCVNKRAEMYVLAKEWFLEGGSIGDNDDLYEEALAVETMPTLDGKFKFPPKDKMKAILGRSPNSWDALVLSFASPIRPKVKTAPPQPKKNYWK